MLQYTSLKTDLVVNHRKSTILSDRTHESKTTHIWLRVHVSFFDVHNDTSLLIHVFHPFLSISNPSPRYSTHPYSSIFPMQFPDSSRCSIHFCRNSRYLCCMNPTAGSFIVNQRLQRHFWCCAVPFPEQCLSVTNFGRAGDLGPRGCSLGTNNKKGGAIPTGLCWIC